MDYSNLVFISVSVIRQVIIKSVISIYKKLADQGGSSKNIDNFEVSLKNTSIKICMKWIHLFRFLIKELLYV